GDWAKNLSTSADDDSVFDRGVPLDRLNALPAQGDAVVDRDVITDLARLADDDTHRVIDEQPTPDDGARVNLHPREVPRPLRVHAGDEAHPVLPQPVRPAVDPHRVQPRVVQ